MQIKEHFCDYRMLMPSSKHLAYGFNKATAYICRDYTQNLQFFIKNRVHVKRMNSEAAR